ncbi:hypothetical protein CGLO_02781 [Colletotrichum gloeosporioides Cg-14]|uniref:Uncharacterized protein n=1 Tax=Colletotrichum gloeosporioides (strain Cg-14) TaxID=1237896 RepID=T0KY53_COLGC|nr:hypothetical protein CGLO_02781 [Colletotrichum gloeosporioides Cg-14]
MDAGVITCNDKLDDCLGAIRDREDGKATPSIQILELAEHVGDDISARLGGQIVILALMTDLKRERCDMATAAPSKTKLRRPQQPLPKSSEQGWTPKKGQILLQVTEEPPVINLGDFVDVGEGHQSLRFDSDSQC